MIQRSVKYLRHCASGYCPYEHYVYGDYIYGDYTYGRFHNIPIPVPSLCAPS
ncbi:MAG: hypothetical protein MH252_01295 [Thermosynechococcaceae cyanobacterium MS004]|nr:hypothetical protein [Thermosynechococcaceae cyanobacterium MS004]